MRISSCQCTLFMILRAASGFSLSTGPLMILRQQRHHRQLVSNSQLNLDGEGMAGRTFNKHLLGDIIRALQPSYLSQLQKSVAGNLKGMQTLDLGPFLSYQSQSTANCVSWEELANTLRQQQTSQEKNFRSNLGQGLIHSPLATHRKFNRSSFDDAAVFVSFFRDSAAWCPYCQKVYMTLEEKQIPYKVVKVDMNSYAGTSKPGDFLQIQPSGSLPCAIIHREGTKDQVIQQSDDILVAIDALENNSNIKIASLFPKSETEKKTEKEYMKFLCDDGRNSLERRLYAEWLWYLTGKRRPDEYRQRFETILDEVDSTLSSTPGSFFLKDFSMADIKFIPFVERQAASLLYYKGFNLRNTSRWPHIVKWLEAMEKRNSYLMTKSDVYTHSRALPAQLSAGCEFYEGCEEMRDAIDSYCLPTSATSTPDSGTAWREPGWDHYHNNIQASKREAAERIIFNHDNICKFAARASGLPGFPAAAAQLADPKAQPNEDALVAVDSFLKCTIGLLLARNDAQKKERLHLATESGRALSKGGEETVQATIDCLDYLRQRIGVPRDMSYPAAQSLREALLVISEMLMQSKLELRENQEKLNSNIS